MKQKIKITEEELSKIVCEYLCKKWVGKNTSDGIVVGFEVDSSKVKIRTITTNNENSSYRSSYTKVS
jgi:hypothetical protein